MSVMRIEPSNRTTCGGRRGAHCASGMINCKNQWALKPKTNKSRFDDPLTSFQEVPVQVVNPLVLLLLLVVFPDFKWAMWVENWELAKSVEYAGQLHDLPEATLRGLLGKPQDLGPHHPEINP